MLLCLGAALTPAIAIGLSRGRMGPLAGTAMRYGFILFPTVIVIYFAAVIRESRSSSRYITTILCMAACYGFEKHQRHGYETMMVYHETREAMANDIRSGMTVADLAERYSGEGLDKVARNKEKLSIRLRALREAEMGIFSQIPDDEMPQLATGPGIENQ